MRRIIVASLAILCLPLISQAAFSINANEATSSDNIIFNSFKTGGELGLYYIPDTLNPNANWGMIAGTCGGTASDRYECQTTVVPATGNNIAYHFGSGSGLKLGYGTYKVFSGSTNCAVGKLNSGACATTGNEEQDFEICASLPCHASSTPQASTSIDIAINYGDFFVDILGFAIMLGVLFFK